MIDRRIQKTKRILSDSLVGLIREKGYENVTIEDIINRANVGRSTFYSHFENKDQLLLAGNEHFKEILRYQNLGECSFSIDFTYFYQHISENYDLALSFFGKKGGHVLIDFFRDIIADILYQHIKRKNKEKDKVVLKKLQFQTDAIATSIIRLLTLWIEDKMSFSVSDMVKMSNEMIKI
jgi:AcrR family transcriptional regulator